MTPADELRAAADRLDTLDKAATLGPWTVLDRTRPTRSGRGFDRVREDRAIRTVDDPFEFVARMYAGRSADADLIVTLRQVAAPLAEAMRVLADLIGPHAPTSPVDRAILTIARAVKQVGVSRG